MLFNPPVVIGQGFECGFEPVDSLFRWDALLLFVGFCVFEVEIIMIVPLLVFSYVIVMLTIVVVMFYEISFIGFGF